MTSAAEDNYLKAIYKIANYSGDKTVSTKSIAEEMQTSAPAVTDMLHKLAEKKLVQYQKYYGVKLSKEGQVVALQLLRRHRLWETFLHDKLGFSWAEVHPLAEQLEHIRSEALIDSLDQFLGQPKFDPHGDPIPNALGNITMRSHLILSEIVPGDEIYQIIAVRQQSEDFLKFLSEHKMTPGRCIRLKSVNAFDRSCLITNELDASISISNQYARQIFVKNIT